MTATITTSSKSYARLLQIIEKQPGISSRNLAAAAGYSLPHTKNALAVISRAKTASPVELGGRNRGWYVQAIAVDLLKAWVSKKRQAKIESQSRQPSVREKIVALSAKESDGASAVKVAALFGLTEKNAERHCLQMVRQGRIFQAKRGGCRTRWFDLKDRADAWAALPAVEKSEIRPRSGRPKRDKAKAKEFKVETAKRQAKKADKKKFQAIMEKPGNAAPVILNGKPSDMRGTIDYSRAKVTICPAPPSIYRHEYNPSSEQHQAFVRRMDELRRGTA